MKIENIINIIEELAPVSLAMDYDNSGLNIGTTREDIKKVLVALDCSMSVVDEAIAWGADMIITHHPLLFNAVKKITPDVEEGGVAFKLIQNNIGLYCAHTSLDAAIGGVNDVLCEMLKIKDTKIVEPEKMGRIGVLETPVTLREFIYRVNENLGINAGYTASDEMLKKQVNQVAVMGGAGGSETMLMKNLGADVFVTGEIKHNQAVDAWNMGFPVIVCGHYESEKVVLEPLIGYLQNHSNGVQYRLSISESVYIRRN